MQERLETENVLFGIVITVFVGITLAMGWITYSQKPHPPEKTLKVLGPSDPSYVKLQNGFTAAYKKIHPEMEIQYISFPWNNIWRKLQFLIVANIPPDVSSIWQANLPQFVYMNSVEPLDEWMRNDDSFDVSSLYQVCVDEGNWDNVQYALPYEFSPVCLWYNKTLFDRHGVAYPSRDWTQDDLVAAAKRLTKDINGDGIPDQYGFYNDNNHWNRYSAFIWMRGGEFYSADWKRCTFDDPKVIASFQWLADLSLKEWVMPKWGYLGTITSTNLMLGGRLGMITDTRYAMTQFYLEKNRDKIKDFTFDVCELPHDVKRASCLVVSQIMMPRTVPAERKQMAWDYMKFVLSKEGQEVIAKENTALSTRIETAEEMVVHPGKMPEHDRAFLDSIAYGRYCYWPFPAEEQFLAARSDLQAVWNGQVSAEEVCRKAAVNMTKAMDDFYRLHPAAKVPIKTKFVPFDKRTVEKDAGGVGSAALVDTASAAQ